MFWPGRMVSNAPAGGATFQSTPPQGGRPAHKEIKRCAWFQRQGGRHRLHSTTGMFQSTPPQGGRRLLTFGYDYLFPGRGGDPIEAANATKSVSIHAPAGGATWTDRRERAHPGFNPRRRGGDWHTADPGATGVSIHAPAGGATSTRQTGSQLGAGEWFQSTPPQGGRPKRLGEVFRQPNKSFQSTPPQGGRRGIERELVV